MLPLLAIAGALLTAASAALAQTDPVPGARRTVFWPPDFHPAEGVAPVLASPLDGFEFRGVLTIAGATFVALHDTANARALTGPVGSTIQGITLGAYDPAAGTVELTAGSFSRRIKLGAAKIVAALPPRISRRPAALVPPADTNPDERIAAVAREIRQRREQRRQLQEAQAQRAAGSSPTVP